LGVSSNTRRTDEALYYASTMIQDAVLRNPQTLTEASQSISSAVRERHPEVNWRGMRGFRNILVHGYLGINMDRVWETVVRDLPALKAHISAIRDQLGETT
jgi:uncharacterized protein with HEPN domain